MPAGVVLGNTQCVLMGDLSLIALGGGKYGSTKVCQVCRDGRVVFLPSMTTAKVKFGVVQVKGRLFIFGGEHGANELSASEALNLSLSPLRKWVSQGSMLSSRADFTPAAYRNCIYLCGGGTPQCEVYDLITRSFQPIDIELPLRAAACALCYGDELILLTPEVNFCYNIDTMKVKWAIPHPHCRVSYIMRPVLRRKWLFCPAISTLESVSYGNIYTLPEHHHVQTLFYGSLADMSQLTDSAAN